MAIAVFIVSGLAGALIALAALLTLGIGPVAALVVFWLGGLAATLALAIDFARSTTLAAVPEEAQAPVSPNDGA